MDNFENAVRTLELDRVLEQVACCCVLDAGSEKIKNLRPLTDIRKIEILLKQTTEAKRLLGTKGLPSLSAPVCIPSALDRASKGAVLTVNELLSMASLLASADNVRKYGEANECDEVLRVLFARMLPNRALVKAIRATIVGEDQIADDASQELYSIRRKIRSSEARIRETLQKYTAGAFSQYLQENIITIRNGRYVVPVKVEHKNDVKGMVHDSSSSGATVFIEPAAIVELNNDIKLLQSEEKNEIERILRRLSAECDGFSEAIKLNYQNIVELSVIFARAEYSFRTDASQPTVTQDGVIDLVRARHPLIDKSKVVPINISLGEKYDTLVITGPNTGGKTVSLKTVGLLTLMAQCGLHIPCNESSRISVFSSVLADIGDEQSIEQSLSTFSSHMVRIIDIIKTAGEKSLVLFDELGAGTDPVEGAALAIAILENVRHKGAKCLATTHYAELKTYALDTERVENASCAFDIETLKPTYRLIIGTPGRSNAFLISERLGLPGDVIQEAQKLIDSSSRNFERVVEKLEADRIEMEKNKEAAVRASVETERLQREALKEREKLIAEAQKELDRARTEATRLISSAKMVSDNTFTELGKLKRLKENELAKQDLQTKRAELREKMRGVEREIDENLTPEAPDDYELPRPLKIGDTVLIARTGKQATVEDVSGDQVKLVSGSIRMRMKQKELRLITDISKVKNRRKGSTASSPRPIVKSEIDLRGEIGEDAWFITDRYLDSAKLAGLNTVTLIHGKGTGALRAALWKYLKGDKRVKDMRLGTYGEGDYGVTVVQLK
ncbi:MAG: endonuclease MutS2 [Firmicutes bacterium]|nr:endonuclease MutS2 [Bacillota bacterium]